MRIYTKRVQILEMTQEELDKFRELMDKAEQGHTVHYAETKLANGANLGVHMVSKEEAYKNEAERLKAADARRHGKNYAETMEARRRMESNSY